MTTTAAISTGTKDGAPRRFVVLLLVSLGSLLGCEGQRKAPPPPATEALPSLPKSQTIDLFFDSTLSMQGFTRIGEARTSHYQQVIQALGNAVTTSWESTSVTLSRFGDDIAPVASVYEVTQPQFYLHEHNRHTYIERVIAHANPQHFTIIVTDLFQNNAEIDPLVRALKERYFQQNLAVGLIAIRSQYAGTVYDVGLDKRKFDYRSDPDRTESFRPFYVLLLGAHANVERYINRFFDSAAMSALPAKHVMLFSKYLNAAPTPFRTAPLLTQQRIRENDLSKYISANDPLPHVKAFHARRASGEATFSAQWNYVPPMWTQFDTDQVITAITAWSSKPTSDKALQLTESVEAAAALVVEPQRTRGVDGQHGTLGITARARLGTLSPGLYRYRVVIHPAHYELPHWVSEWTLGEEHIAGLSSKSAGFSGSRTYNLAEFVGGLGGAMLSVSVPVMADLYCYIYVD